MDCRIAGYQRRLTGAALVVLIALALFGAQAAFAAERVGRVVSANGRVTAEQPDVSARSLARGDAIYAGDTIVTSRRGRIQMRFRDDGMVDLEPLSRFRVKEYSGAQGGGNVVLSFLRGAMRTITGAIGYDSGESYQMETPVATIGVRGTAYALRYCDPSCVEAGGEAGLYGRVDKGAIVADGVRFAAGDYFFAPEEGAPGRIVAPPDGILDGRDDSGLQGNDNRITDVRIRPLDQDERGDYGPVLSENEALDPEFESGPPPDDTPVTGLTGVSAAVGGPGMTSFPSATLHRMGDPYTTNGSNQVISAGFFENTVTAAVDEVNPAESGSFPALGVDWGRWNGVVTLNGDPYSSSNFAYTITDNLTEPTQLASMSGSLDYSLAGGPSAFDNVGNLWSVDSLSLGVDFDAQAVSLTSLDLSGEGGNGGSFSFNNGDVTGQSLDLDNNSLFLNVDRFGSGGTIRGQFVGTNADGAVVVFTISDSDGVTTVTGTQVLKTP